ncbi:MAG: hypothetical protein PSX81_15130 [bacterium]|nr:hypothetical protein [bacterium]
MPLIFEKTIDTAKKLAVWQITESDEELFAIHQFSIRHDYTKKRNLELAVSQILLNHLLGFSAHLNLTKDAYGKPFLNNSNIAISFSHSKQMVACIIDLNGSDVGIDIEIIRERIQYISHKFQSTRDFTILNGILSSHLIWGGKEVLYKIYAKKELDFIDHLSVNFNSEISLTNNQFRGEGYGTVDKGHHTSVHHLFYETIGEFMLVWGY